MKGLRGIGAAFAAALLLIPAAAGIAAPLAGLRDAPTIDLTIESKTGVHRFRVEVARTYEEQQRGLMYRTDIPQDGGMLFTPYPAEGGRGQEAHFWMHNTPSALDIIFIKADGTIDKIAADAKPYSEDRIYSDGPVTAVLEINGGRAAALGIAVGDRVNWQGRK
ncbi:DUF192 domain-containing protein [Sphingomonas sp. LB-2]|uniref:DUF192 domain-containing protein n=1 Tax=Sphingomonas caeni TaxID=2984949 RepID=UPI00222EEB4F|nr:DUF192 domain-containing protein [Sphingomonas caeni]MCW3847523.1 DUF192 domain-containing protein [Sphingomonas caeni]